jgi:predicted ATPase
MIRHIKVKNFKTLKLAELELSNLNLFAGLNGMGKSSFLQVLLLLRQSYLQNLLQNNELGLNGSLVNIGLGSDAYAQFGDEETIYFELETFDGKKAQWTFSATKALSSRNLHKDEDVLTCLDSVHPETLPKLKLWIPRCPLFGVQSASVGIFIGVSGWTL